MGEREGERGGRERGRERRERGRERVEREGEVAQKFLLCRCPAVVSSRVVQSSFFQKLSSCRRFVLV